MPNKEIETIPQDDIVDFAYIISSLKEQYGDKIAEHWQLVSASQGQGTKLIYDNATSAYLSLMDGKIESARMSLKLVGLQCDIRDKLYEEAKKTNDEGVRALAKGIDLKHNQDLSRLTEILRLELSGSKQ